MLELSVYPYKKTKILVLIHFKHLKLVLEILILQVLIKNNKLILKA